MWFQAGSSECIGFNCPAILTWRFAIRMECFSRKKQLAFKDYLPTARGFLTYLSVFDWPWFLPREQRFASNTMRPLQQKWI
ncbi:MAG: hypothetical protein BA870_01060 [Desulfuromonadales bacterium C00003094]|nr:MAG: hypothetical protein BA870_01060 [Desulfuromonadales bacterium C00003094]